MSDLRWLAALAAVVALACGGADGEGEEAADSAQAEEAAEMPAEPTELDAASVAERMAAGEDIFLLDVRTPEELQEDGVIAGYTHIPIDELENRLAEVPMDKPIVAY